MKALLSLAAGGPETLVLRDVPDPVPGPGQVLLRVRAAGVNYPDSLIIRDLYQVKAPRPISPGGELCGDVLALGPDTQGPAVGDRVIARCGSGAMAEQIALDADRCVVIPPSLPTDEAAVFLLTYATAMHALQDCAHLRAGERLLVLGAAGGVGCAAMDLGRALGARVLAAVSSDDKAAFARAHGAEAAMVYPAVVDGKPAEKALAQDFKTLVGPQGADVVFDPVGGAYSEAALRTLRPHGRHLVVGFTAGIARLPTNLPLLKRCSIVGVDWRAFCEQEPAANARNVQALLALWQAGRLRPAVAERFPLARGAEAIARLEARQALGKLVVQIA